MFQSLNRTFIASLILLVTGPAYAAQGQLYVLAGAGKTSIDDSESAYHYKASSSSYRLGVGYTLNDFISIEGYYADFGKADDNINGGKIKESANGLGAAVAASLPLNDAFSLFAKLGIISWHSTAKSNMKSVKDDGSDLTYGIGGAYNFTTTVGLRLEFEKADFNGVDVKTMLANIVYRIN